MAILLDEPGSDKLVRRINDAPVVAAGAPTLVEATIVLSARLHHNAKSIVNEFLRDAEIEVVAFTPEHYLVAVDAFVRYGKGRHPAALNFGDCITYAVARISGMPLLFTGTDFSKTDLIR